MLQWLFLIGLAIYSFAHSWFEAVILEAIVSGWLQAFITIYLIKFYTDGSYHGVLFLILNIICVV